MGLWLGFRVVMGGYRLVINLNTIPVGVGKVGTIVMKTNDLVSDLPRPWYYDFCSTLTKLAYGLKYF
ncbi:MAG: hypothetical protein DWQ04_04545 [Chloroflexi bacterium]|nr:MAG: hypothetical protein DWQ04_04545 [Chloroflexota bacterium]